MKASEWLEIAATVKERWPHARIPNESVKRWGEDLADLPGEHVATAYEVLYRSGEHDHPPNPGRVRVEVVRLVLDLPEWGEVLAVLKRAAGKGSVPTFRGEETVMERDEVVAGEHPAIVRFVEVLGWTQISDEVLGRDGSDEARLRDKWKTFTGKLVRAGSLEGLPAPEGMRELARMKGEPKQIGEALGSVMKRLEPADKKAAA